MIPLPLARCIYKVPSTPFLSTRSRHTQRLYPTLTDKSLTAKVIRIKQNDWQVHELPKNQNWTWVANGLNIRISCVPSMYQVRVKACVVQSVTWIHELHATSQCKIRQGIVSSANRVEITSQPSREGFTHNAASHRAIFDTLKNTISVTRSKWPIMQWSWR